MQNKKTEQYSITLLGTGTSTGIPVVGCSCAVCTDPHPKNKRMRTSALIRTPSGKNILIDTTPDLRSQLLREKVMHIDGGIITHDHADHFHGIDDLRPYCFGPPKKTIPLISNQATLDVATARFPYIFVKDYFNKDRPQIGGGIPLLDMQVVPENEDIEFLGESFFIRELPHGYLKTLGILHQKMAYIIDCISIPTDFVEKLAAKKLDLLVIDCLQYEKHDTHLNTEKCFEYIRRIKPKKAILIHMNHHMEHFTLESIAQKAVGPHVEVGYDGMILNYS